ncbi:rhamnan synthesis F family protein [Azotobacter vinelandii]|uniref:rhamnan synthesis F family protein n=1 Tax=Azotobacter vinelandii TaxID=354 RepID=UPI0009208EB6|nr:rhamnan synthesis F family protein [Azotobacter vinelandii]SFY32883.1 Rhamnan synthesis protein F [Azotobacter vinelandii]
MSLPSDFSPETYLALNPDVKAASVDPVQHYLQFGMREGRSYSDKSRDLNNLMQSGIFDPEWYSHYYPDIRTAGIDPARHFLDSGAREGRWASLFFRSDWYMDNHPDVRESGENPLFHYINKGSALGYEPNPFFEPDYYRKKYKIGKDEPLRHFILNGHKGFNPSPRFDSADYIKKTGCKGNPLKHYLQIGMQAGVTPLRAEDVSWIDDVSGAFIEVVKESAVGKDPALFITHTPDGSIKPHVLRYASALQRNHRSVFLIIAADRAKVSIPEELYKSCDNILVRQNSGFDFAAWAHILKRRPELKEKSTLLITNDSIVGPIGNSLDSVFQKISNEESDIIGLTENFEHAEHLQSFFIIFNSRALQSASFAEFWNAVVIMNDKSKVIRDYEITLTARMKAAGLTAKAIFNNYSDKNHTIFEWERLISIGFPFVKMEVIKGSNSKTKERIRKIIA